MSIVRVWIFAGLILAGCAGDGTSSGGGTVDVGGGGGIDGVSFGGDLGAEPADVRGGDGAGQGAARRRGGRDVGGGETDVDVGGVADAEGETDVIANPDGRGEADAGGRADVGESPDTGGLADVGARADMDATPDVGGAPDAGGASDSGALTDLVEPLDVAQVPDAAPVSDAGQTPDVEQTPDVDELPDAGPAPDVDQAPDIVDLPDVDQTPDVVQAPDIQELPDVLQTPDVEQTPDIASPPDTGGAPDVAAADTGSGEPDSGGPPLPFPYSWDGSFEPTAADFPMAGLFDNEYFDGHAIWTGEISPILPPGVWDWNDANDDLANWRNFEEHIGVFEMLVDDQGNHYGWRLQGNTPAAIDYAGPSAYYEGTPGIDVLDLGPGGLLHSFTVGNLGDGPDVLIFDGAWSLDFRTGSSLSGSKWDNDLVVAGCTPDPGPGYQFKQASIHTGPGSDWIFALDMSGAAVDAGNGDGGKTDVLDPGDGDDLIVLRGNMRDFRVFGGAGDDTAVWYVDEGKESIAYLGPNFFGGGGSGDAVWGDPGVDRLVLVVPPDTQIVDKTPTPPGALLVRFVADYGTEIWWDEPVINDPYAKYCITCGTGPGGRKTVTLEYKSATTPAFTGYFWVTAFEELQLGVGKDAKMFRIDDVSGKLVAAPDLVPYDPPGPPAGVCDPKPW